jgi:hypothetical protein
MKKKLRIPLRNPSSVRSATRSCQAGFTTLAPSGSRGPRRPWPRRFRRDAPASRDRICRSTGGSSSCAGPVPPRSIMAARCCSGRRAK